MNPNDITSDLYPLPEVVARDAITPAVIVYLEHVRHNVEYVLGLAGDPIRWRPHLKTTKIPELWALLLDSGIRRVKCATTREAAEFLALADRRGERCDLLVAYPLIGPALRRLAELAQRHPTQHVSVLSEDPAHATAIPAELDVFVDVNAGMDRTGVPATDRERIEAVALAAGSRFRGVHAYEGNLRLVDPAHRDEDAASFFTTTIDVVQDLRDAGIAVTELVTTGTPTFAEALAFAPFAELRVDHQISPGTVVLSDIVTAERLPDIALRPAAIVLSRVVSRPAAGLCTADAGHKAISVDAGDPCGMVVGYPDLVPQHPTEEHLPMKVTRGATPAVGEMLRIVPRHVCPTINLADQVILLDGDEVRVASVTARGHELFAGS